MTDPLDGIFTIAGPSGGAGRTTLTLSLGTLLAQAGSEVLLVELDPRGSLASLVDQQPEGFPGGILEALSGQKKVSECVVQTVYPGLSLLPSEIRSSAEQHQLEMALADWKALPRLLDPLREWYHTILVDVPAGTDRLTRSALGAADEVLLVLQPDPLAVRALPAMLEALVEVRKVRLPQPELAGIVLNKVNVHQPFVKQVLETLYARFAPLVLETAIPQDTWFIEAAARAMPLPYMMPEAPGSVALSRVMAELRQRLLNGGAAARVA